MKVCQVCKGDYDDPVRFPDGCDACDNTGFQIDREKKHCMWCGADRDFEQDKKCRICGKAFIQE